MRELAPVNERFFLDSGQELFLYDVVLYLKEGLAELLEGLLHGHLVDNGIGIQPFDLLVNLDKDASPIGCELELIFSRGCCFLAYCLLLFILSLLLLKCEIFTVDTNIRVY